jgi:hypothetical protein
MLTPPMPSAGTNRVWPPFTPLPCAAESHRDPTWVTAWSLWETRSTATASIRFRVPVALPFRGSAFMHVSGCERKPDRAQPSSNVVIPAHDRMRLERLARYAARPAISSERLSELPDGRLLYRLKWRWRNGTTEVVFERSDFIAKLAALVPAPRAHLARYHGVLAPAAEWRPLIVPKPDVQFGPCANLCARPESAPAVESEPETATSAPPPRRKNYSWSELLRRVFDIDVLICERCSGRVRVIAAIEEPKTIQKILNHLGLPSKPPPITPCRYESSSLPVEFVS